jgi:ATP-binding cassette, subfamily B, bacterial
MNDQVTNERVNLHVPNPGIAHHPTSHPALSHSTDAPSEASATREKQQRRNAFSAVFAFSLGYWRRQIPRVLWAGGAISVATLMDICIPLFAGKLIDAVSVPRDAGALDNALLALGSIMGLGLIAVAFRFLAFAGITQLTLRVMSRLLEDSFWRVQRFSTDWHANTFGGSTVRKITRGMWALDQLNDTVILALFPACIVLLGSSLLLAWHWPMMGLLVLVGAIVYIAVAATLSVTFVGPAAALSNQWDTRLGGVLADSITCNAATPW